MSDWKEPKSTEKWDLDGQLHHQARQATQALLHGKTDASVKRKLPSYLSYFTSMAVAFASVKRRRRGTKPPASEKKMKKKAEEGDEVRFRRLRSAEKAI